MGVIGRWLRRSLRANDESGMTAISRDRLGEMARIGDLRLARGIDWLAMFRSTKPFMSLQLIAVGIEQVTGTRYDLEIKLYLRPPRALPHSYP